ncbi:MAG TPA: DUF4267 domain-containing protein [Solirubrobacterales bacterium]
MFGRTKMDPLARQVALEIGATRVALGTSVLLATRPALKALGFGAPGATGEALARFGGGRDIALGVATFAARDDRQALRTTVLISSACDLADAVALGISARHPETRTAGIGGVLAGSAAAIAGLWAWRRL